MAAVSLRRRPYHGTRFARIDLGRFARLIHNKSSMVRRRDSTLEAQRLIEAAHSGEEACVAIEIIGASGDVIQDRPRSRPPASAGRLARRRTARSAIGQSVAPFGAKSRRPGRAAETVLAAFAAFLALAGVRACARAPARPKRRRPSKPGGRRSRCASAPFTRGAFAG